MTQKRSGLVTLNFPPQDLLAHIRAAKAAGLHVALRSDTSAPSLLHLTGTNSMLAMHADYSLVGPVSFSVPGYPFSPARPGETIILWGVGFGLTANPLVNGSSSQSGTLPGKPEIQIGGVDGTVTFAGLVSPGLYQINMTIPTSAANGDNPVTCSWNGWMGVAEGSIAIQQ